MIYKVEKKLPGANLTKTYISSFISVKCGLKYISQLAMLLSDLQREKEIFLPRISRLMSVEWLRTRWPIDTNDKVLSGTQREDS